MKVERFFYLTLIMSVCFLLYLTHQFSTPLSYDPLGPKPYPLLILSLLLVGLVLLAGQKNYFYSSLELSRSVGLRVVCMLGIFLFYSLSFESLGFIISTILVVFGMGKAFGGHTLKAIITAIVMSVCFYWLFDYLLDVPLPLGLLDGIFQ